MIVYKIRPSIYSRVHEKEAVLFLKNDDDVSNNNKDFNGLIFTKHKISL